MSDSRAVIVGLRVYAHVSASRLPSSSSFVPQLPVGARTPTGLKGLLAVML